MVTWKNMNFWRAEQQKPRRHRVTHASRFNPEGDIERALESIAGTDWGATAQDRARWNELCADFVARYDVPWATGKQTSIADNLHPHSAHHTGRDPAWPTTRRHAIATNSRNHRGAADE